MAWRCGSLPRSLISTARSSSIRTTSSVPRLRPSPPHTVNSLHSRRSILSHPRTIGALGCAQSLMPLHSVVAATRLTSHISVEARACCELSQASLGSLHNWLLTSITPQWGLFLESWTLNRYLMNCWISAMGAASFRVGSKSGWVVF